MFVRERNSATYQVSSYYISKMFLEIPVEIFSTILWASILYFAVPLKLTPGAFFFYILIIVLSADCGVAMAQLAAAMFDSQEVATAILVIIMSMMVIFSGFFIHQTNIPDWWIWMYWISYAHYGIAAMFINEFSDNSDYGANGPAVLSSLSLTNVNQFLMMAGLLVALIIIRLLSYLGFRFRKIQKQ